MKALKNETALPVRARGLLVGALVVVFGSAAAPVAANDGAAAAGQKRQLVEQKLRLVEQLLKSPAAKGAAYGRDAESPQLVERGAQQLAEARAALAANDVDTAAQLLDQALRSASKASAKVAAGGTSLSESAQRAAIRDLTEQLATYRASLIDLSRDAHLGAAARAAVDTLDAHATEAATLAAQGQLGDASKRLSEAYRSAVQELSRLRAGQTVVMDLKFDSPADEYAYEQRRHRSHEMLIEMAMHEGRADGAGKRDLVQRFVGQSRVLFDQAEKQAGSGDYRQAVTTMERATSELMRALQSVGIPVF
jgi:hypothetical protein